MNKEDFDSEVNALFEEDSVLAQAVINLQNRRKNAEAKHVLNESGDRTDTASENTEALISEPVDSEASDNDIKDRESIESIDAEISEIAAEAVIGDTEEEKHDSPVPETSEIADKKATSRASEKKKKKKAPRKKETKKPDAESVPLPPESIASTVQLLEFVSGENTVRPDGKSTLFDFGFPLPPTEESGIEDGNEANTDTPEEAAEMQNADIAEVAIESDAPSADAEQPSDDGSQTDSQTDSLSDSVYNEIPDVIEGYADSTYFGDNDEPQISDFAADTPVDEAAHDTNFEAENTDVTDAEPEEIDTLSPTPEEVEKYAINGENDKKSDKSNEKPRFIDGVFDFLELFIFSLAAVLLITTFFFRHSVVDGGSMEQTLFNGEHIIISNLFYEPERGDIIVCEDYSLENAYYRKPLVKRVIGIPGDVVEIRYDRFKKRSDVYVNGEKLNEDYVYIDKYPEYRNDSGRWYVGEGEVFVMGDHRNNSSDSRDIGCIRIDSIIGKALIRFYPFEKFGKIE